MGGLRPCCCQKEFEARGGLKFSFTRGFAFELGLRFWDWWLALSIDTGSLGDTSRGSRYRNQALSAHPPNPIKRPSKQGQIVAGALARPTAFLGGCKKLPLPIPYIKKPSALMVWCLLGCSRLFCSHLNSFAGKGNDFFRGRPASVGRTFMGHPVSP